MNYNGINFNEAFYNGKKFEVFVKNEKHHGLTDEQMKEAFELMQTKKEVKKEESK